jgi:hypothetical protein
MPNSTLTIAFFEESVSTLLGADGVDVELSPGTYKKLLAQVILLLNRSRPQRSIFALPVSTSQTKYGPINAGKPGFKGVVNVQFVPSQVIQGRVDPFDAFNTVRSKVLAGSDGTTFADLDAQIQGIKYARNVVSTETEWRGVWERDKNYYLYISTGGQSVSCSVEYTWNITPDDDENTGLSWVDADDVDWVVEYGTALAKQTLSRIRGKFQGITNAEGSSDPTDYAELAQEGREDAERLRLAMENRRRPLPPVIG